MSARSKRVMQEEPKFIDLAWKSFRESLFPEDVPESMVRALRSTFYAGIVAFLTTMRKFSDAEMAAEFYAGVEREAKEFQDALDAGPQAGLEYKA